MVWPCFCRFLARSANKTKSCLLRRIRRCCNRLQLIEMRNLWRFSVESKTVILFGRQRSNYHDRFRFARQLISYFLDDHIRSNRFLLKCRFYANFMPTQINYPLRRISFCVWRLRLNYYSKNISEFDFNDAWFWAARLDSSHKWKWKIKTNSNSHKIKFFKFANVDFHR